MSTNRPVESSSSETTSFFQAAGILGLATAGSRILGFARDWLIAVFYGTSLTAQAFVVAFRIPNLLRNLIGEGAANSAFVPVFSQVRTLEGKESWAKLAQAMWLHLSVGLLLICGMGMAAAPVLVRWVAPGFVEDPALMALTVRLTRWLFPFLGLVGLYAFLTGLLNSVRHFTRPSLGPILLNVSMIVGMLLVRADAMGLCWGILAGGLLQIVVQWPELSRQGINLIPRWVQHPGVAQIRRLLLPRMAGTAVYQGSVLVDTIFASFAGWVGAGGVAALYFAQRFMQLPLGLFGVSFAQAALPTLSTQAAQNQTDQVRETFRAALKASLFIAVPSGVGLILLGEPIIQTLLERGAFSSASTQLTASALTWYAAGLASLCAVKVLVNTLYALGDTWTPVRSAGWALGINVGLNFLLVGPMGLAGLALATTLSSTCNGLHLFGVVRRRIGALDQPMGGWFLRLLLATCGMGAVAQTLWHFHPAPGGLAAVGWLLLSITLATASFFGCAALLRIEEAQKGIQWLFRKK